MKEISTVELVDSLLETADALKFRGIKSGAHAEKFLALAADIEELHTNSKSKAVKAKEVEEISRQLMILRLC
jgi:hypothetical protein